MDDEKLWPKHYKPKLKTCKISEDAMRKFRDELLNMPVKTFDSGFYWILDAANEFSVAELDNEGWWFIGSDMSSNELSKGMHVIEKINVPSLIGLTSVSHCNIPKGFAALLKPHYKHKNGTIVLGHKHYHSNGIDYTYIARIEDME